MLMPLSLYSQGENPGTSGQETGWNVGSVWAKRKMSRLVRTQTPIPPIRPMPCSLDWLKCPGSLACTGSAVLGSLVYWLSYPGSLACTDSTVLAPLFVMTQLSWFRWFSDSAILAPLFVLTLLSWLSNWYWLSCLVDTELSGWYWLSCLVDTDWAL